MSLSERTLRSILSHDPSYTTEQPLSDKYPSVSGPLVMYVMCSLSHSIYTHPDECTRLVRECFNDSDIDIVYTLYLRHTCIIYQPITSVFIEGGWRKNYKHEGKKL